MNRRITRALVAAVALLASAARAHAQSDTATPPEAYAVRRARLVERVGANAVLIVPGAHLVGNHDLPRQNSNFWYLTGVESPYAILVIAPDARAGARTGATRTALFLPDTFQFLGAQFPMADSGFRRASWNLPRRRLAPGTGAARITGIVETYPITEFATRVRELAGAGATLYLPRAGDSLYAPPGVARIATVEMQQAASIAALFPERRVEDLTPHLRKLRLVKDRFEIAALRDAARVSAASLVTLMRALRPGMNDLEAAGILEADWKKRGSPRASFGPIISSGTDAMTFFSLRGERYESVNRVMQPDDLLFADYGAAEVRHYGSDLCRTLPVSGRFTAEQRRYYDIVLEAQDSAIAAIRPGVMMLDVIKAAARVFRAHGLEKHEDVATMGADHVWGVMPSPTHYLARDGGIMAYTRFGGGVRDLGHHIGIDATDDRDWSGPLLPGMVVTIEPKLYIPDRAIAIMIEDMILVTPTGHENLSAGAPKRAADIERVMRGR
jgi:Xaa-Pro aminopeptidase